VGDNERKDHSRALYKQTKKPIYRYHTTNDKCGKILDALTAVKQSGNIVKPFIPYIFFNISVNGMLEMWQMP
jgi:hypothetical protein